MDLHALTLDAADRLGMDVSELNEMVDQHLAGDPVSFDYSDSQAVFDRLVEAMSAATKVALSRDAVELILVVDDNGGTLVQLRRRLWEDGIGTERFNEALIELLDKGVLATDVLGPTYTLTPLGQRMMPSLYRQLGITKLV